MTHEQGAAETRNGPLAGVRVLDLTSVVLGPYATQMLGDLGADIIKIEPPEGDTTRHTGPRVSRDMASLFMGVNRNKRSVVLDLKQPRCAATRCCGWSTPPTCSSTTSGRRSSRRSGSAPTRCCARNPRLIYAGLHGWREDGPYSGRPAYDDIIQGLSGVAGLMDRLTGEPRYAPTILCDKTCGLVASQAILAALFSPREHRPRPVRRSADVRDHGVVHHGRASARPHFVRPAGRPAIRACWRRGGGRIAPPTAICARCPTPTRNGGGSGPRSASRR